MSFSIKLKNLLNKNEPKDILGLVFRPQSLAFCHVPENNPPLYKSIPANAANYSKALTVLKEKYPSSGQCNLILAASMYQIVQVDKPNVPDTEINGALKWQVKDLVPFSPDNMVVDYFEAPGVVGSTEKINVVCASLNKLKDIVEQLSRDGFNVKNITTEEFAFTSLVPVADDAYLLVCQQPHEEVLLLIVKQGKIYFHRRLRGFTQMATKSEAELSMSVIDPLSLEIQRSTDYFERQLKQAPIKYIKIILPMKTESFIARKLAENTHIEVTLLDFPDVESVNLETKKAHQAIIAENVSGSDDTESNEVIKLLEVNETSNVDREFAAAIGAAMLNSKPSDVNDQHGDSGHE
jgi:MSHA biogenesis protein MshI